MHQVHQGNAKVCLDINEETNLALLHIRITPLAPWFPCTEIQLTYKSHDAGSQ